VLVLLESIGYSCLEMTYNNRVNIVMAEFSHTDSFPDKQLLSETCERKNVWRKCLDLNFDWA